MKQRGLLFIIVLVMFLSVSAVSADQASADEDPELYWLKVNRKANGYCIQT